MTNDLLRTVKIEFPRIEVGTQFEKFYTIKNDSSRWPIVLEITSSNNEVVAKYPDTIMSGQEAKVSVTAKPKLKRDLPIEAKLTIKTTRLIG